MGANEARNLLGPRKRGRRTILTSSVLAAIERILRQEQGKPPEQRMTIESMAHEIHKDLKAAGEPVIPKISTLRKEISTRRAKRSDLDKPWDMLSLGKVDCSIPPGALPVVLSFWAWSLKSRGVQITVREAQWAARLSSLEGCMHPEVFGVLVDAYSTAEILAASPGNIYDIGQLYDLMAWVWLSRAKINRLEDATVGDTELEKLMEDLMEKIRLPQHVHLTVTPDEGRDILDRARTLGVEADWELLGNVDEHLSQQRKRGKK